MDELDAVVNGMRNHIHIDACENHLDYRPHVHMRDRYYITWMTSSVWALFTVDF